MVSGLENLFHLTLRKRYELLVDMEDFEGNKAFARYSSFSIDPESYGYTLHVSGYTDGGAGESAALTAVLCCSDMEKMISTVKISLRNVLLLDCLGQIRVLLMALVLSTNVEV